MAEEKDIFQQDSGAPGSSDYLRELNDDVEAILAFGSEGSASDARNASAESEAIDEEGDGGVPARKDVLHFDMDAVAAYGKGSAAKAVKPEPRIVLLRDFCINPSGGRCERCAMACPADAVSFGEDGLPVIGDAACTMCGICLGICDAFTSNDVTMTDLATRMRRVAQRGEGVFVTCPKNVERLSEGVEVAPCVVEVPCLAALSPEFWTLALAEGLDLKVACDLALCAGCDRGGDVAEMLYTHAIETAQEWTGREINIVDEVPEKTGYFQSFVVSGEVDRRGALTHIADNVTDAASGEYRKRNSSVLQDFYERQERMRAQTRQMSNPLPQVNRYAEGGITHKLLQPKRKMLLDAITRDPSIAERVPLVVSATDCFACCNALACTRVCPTQARSAQVENGLLAFDARLCIGCGLCVGACAQGAAYLEEATAEVFADFADGAKLACPGKLAEWEAQQERAAEAAKPQADKLIEAL